MAELKAVFSVLIPKFIMRADVTLRSLNTHWDIANQPTEVHKVTIERRDLSINICGAHSTGKTYLLNELRGTHGDTIISNCCFISEIARTIMAQNGWTRNDLKSNSPEFIKLQELILHQQNESELSALQNGSMYISDRGLDPLAYLSFYSTDSEFSRVCALPQVQKMVGRYQRESITILLEPSALCIRDDGTRWLSDLEELNKFTLCFEIMLQMLSVPYVKIPCTVPLHCRKAVVSIIYNAAGGAS